LGITKTTVLSLMLVMVTMLTTLTLTTTITAVYAGGDDDNNNNNRDGNKQKAEDDSSAGIADCDDEVERAGFDCIAIAANDVEIETPEATLSVCKEVLLTSDGPSPEDFDFTVTGNNPSPEEFAGDENCVDVTIGPGEYAVSEVLPIGFSGRTEIEGDCVQDPNFAPRATGEIQAGETQECRFINLLGP
jgi:hypothetical protein